MVTATTDNPYARNQLYLIPVSELQPDPDQPRKFIDPDALRELTASVSQVGVLEPILFRCDNGTKYIVAGERRLAAGPGRRAFRNPRHLYRRRQLRRNCPDRKHPARGPEFHRRGRGHEPTDEKPQLQAGRPGRNLQQIKSDHLRNAVLKQAATNDSG